MCLIHLITKRSVYGHLLQQAASCEADKFEFLGESFIDFAVKKQSKKNEVGLTPDKV